MMVIFFCSLRGCFILGVLTPFVQPRLRAVLTKVSFSMVGFGNKTGWETTLPMRLLTWAVGGLIMLLLMLDVAFLGSVDVGILVLLDLHRFFIAISRAVVN